MTISHTAQLTQIAAETIDRLQDSIALRILGVGTLRMDCMPAEASI
jgi:hypothetical protein